MNADQREWLNARDDLVKEVVKLGFPVEFGDEIAKTLGSPKAMRRMASYLYNTGPQDITMVVDEMLAIRSEIDTWRRKKESEEANARYNEILNFGFDED